MATLTKLQVLQVIRRAYGPDAAHALTGRLPDRINLDDSADVELLARLGLSRDRLFDALGGEA
jgi:hypothetical protein